jgi:hypothetical protein
MDLSPLITESHRTHHSTSDYSSSEAVELHIEIHLSLSTIPISLDLPAHNTRAYHSYVSYSRNRAQPTMYADSLTAFTVGLMLHTVHRVPQFLPSRWILYLAPAVSPNAGLGCLFGDLPYGMSHVSWDLASELDGSDLLELGSVNGCRERVSVWSFGGMYGDISRSLSCNSGGEPRTYKNRQSIHARSNTRMSYPAVVQLRVGCVIENIGCLSQSTGLHRAALKAEQSYPPFGYR